jgi:hypothetical protein
VDPKDQFEKMLSRLSDLLLFGKAHLKIGRGVGQMITSEPAISQVAPTFWGLTINAHLDIAQLLAFKLFDSRAGTLTLSVLLSHAEQNPTIFANTSHARLAAAIQIARTQISSLKKPLTRIAAKRNRLIAHLDQLIVNNPKKLEKAIAVTFSDLNYAFFIAAAVLNEMKVKFQDAMSDFELLYSSDYEMVGQLIVQAKCEQIKRYEAEFGPWDGPRPKNCS